MRTELLRETEKKISSINQQVTHAFFIGEQFISDNSSILAKYPDELTSVLYEANPYKNKFNYRLNKINDVYKKYNSFILISSFVFSYSVFELYQEELLRLIGTIKGSTCPKPRDTSLIDTIFLCLGSLSNANFTQEELDTIDYIRLRRNCLVHAEGKPKGYLINMIRNQGRNLNSFWLRTLNVTFLDFSSMSVEKLSENEFIDLIRLLRYLTAKIDSRVLSLFNKTDIILFTLSEFKAKFAGKINNRNKARTETMFANFIQRKFDIHREDLDFSNINFGDVV